MRCFVRDAGHFSDTRAYHGVAGANVVGGSRRFDVSGWAQPKSREVAKTMKSSTRVVCALVMGLLVCGCDTFGPPQDRATPPTTSTTVAPVPTVIACVPVDKDGDGTALNPCGVGDLAEDCDDSDPTRSERIALYVDADGDGFGTSEPSEYWLVCVGDSKDGFVPNRDDCDDSLSGSHEFVWRDQDEDGFGAGAAICGAVGEGWSSSAGDCRDDDLDINPEATSEVALDGVDVDCDSFDAPEFELDSAITWDQPLCTGGVLGIVGFEFDGFWLVIANIGTVAVSDATLVLRSLGSNDVILETKTYLLPTLNPGETVLEGRLQQGSYQARFEYGTQPLLVRDVTLPLESNYWDSGTGTSEDGGRPKGGLDGGMVVQQSPDADASNDTRGDTDTRELAGDSGLPSALDSERCEQAKQPSFFSYPAIRVQ